MARGYKVVFTGQLVDGVAEPTARFALADRFKLERSKIDRFFAGQPFVVKVCPTREEAERYQLALTRIGLICSVIELEERGQGKKLDKAFLADRSTPPADTIGPHTQEPPQSSGTKRRGGYQENEPPPPAGKPRRTSSKDIPPLQAILIVIGSLVLAAHAILLFDYGSVSPCRAAAQRLVEEEYAKGGPPKSNAEALGRAIGRSISEPATLALTYARVNTKSIGQCYAIAFGLSYLE